ncbi:MAG TPA: hypothetical protein VEJ88_02125, partial [Dissulfurispiraceae bacterium]|nr:hypothetical protein [Dissulfurispiraceae bacterium]
MKRYAGLVAILAAVISSLTALNIIFFKSLQMETAEQFNKQQLLIASAKASDIKAYIGRMRERMLHISQLTSTFRINSAEGYTFITDGIFRDNGRIKMEIRFVDPKGKI